MPPHSASASESPASRTIVILGFDGVAALDLFGPLEAFTAATSPAIGWHGPRRYDVVVASLSGEPFSPDAGVPGVRITPSTSLEALQLPIDTLVVPGGAGVRTEVAQAALTSWLVRNHGSIRRISSVCTGVYGLAASGLLDGRRVTTHWRYAEDLARAYPAIDVDPDCLFLKQEKFYTSAGVTAGIDLSLALIEEDYGASTALAVARELVVYLKRAGGQAQFSEPLRFQVRGREPMSDLVAWIYANLGEDLSLDRLAERACLCPRQLSRVFSAKLGSAPGAFVERARIDEAMRRLRAPPVRIEQLGHALGYRSTDAFTRAFRRVVGITPTEFAGPRQTSGTSGPGDEG